MNPLVERGSIHSTIHSILLHDLHRNPEDGNPFSPFQEYAGGVHDFAVVEEEDEEDDDDDDEANAVVDASSSRQDKPLKDVPTTSAKSSLLSPRSLSGSARWPLHQPHSSSLTQTAKTHRRIVSEAKSLSLKLVDAMTVSEKLKIAFDLPSLEEYQSGIF